MFADKPVKMKLVRRNGMPIADGYHRFALHIVIGKSSGIVKTCMKKIRVSASIMRLVDYGHSSFPSIRNRSFQRHFQTSIMDIQVGNISHIIQLAIAPVFLLTGVGTKLTVLTNRLARIIDRSRVLEDRLRATDAGDRANSAAELETLYRRAHLINYAITLSTCCGLLVCVVIAALFIGDALDLALEKLIALLFVLGMFALIGSFIFLLREIFVATGTLSMQRSIVPKKPE